MLAESFDARQRVQVGYEARPSSARVSRLFSASARDIRPPERRKYRAARPRAAAKASSYRRADPVNRHV